MISCPPRNGHTRLARFYTFFRPFKQCEFPAPELNAETWIYDEACEGIGLMR